MKINKKRFIAASFLIFLSVSSFSFSPLYFPYIDNKSSQYLNSTLKNLTIIYTTTRALNAVISIIKDSEIDIAPGGIGATVAIDEVVDPLDDLIERFSFIVLISIASVGIQKVIYVVGIKLFFKFL